MAHLAERAFFSHDPVHLENIISPLQKRSSHVRFNTAVVGFNKDGADVEQDAERNAKCKHDGRHPSRHTRNHFLTCAELVAEL